MTQRRSCPSQSVLVVGFGEEMLPPPPPPGPVVVCRRPATFLGCFNIENRSSPLLPKAESLYHDRLSLERCAMQCAVSWPFPSWNRSTLTEIYLCHACPCHEILRTETAGQVASHAADHGWLATLEAGLRPGGPAERYRQHRAQEACVGLRGRLCSSRPPRREEGGGGMGTKQRTKVS
jgi:hypothetical protein